MKVRGGDNPPEQAEQRAAMLADKLEELGISL